ncbi:MAG: hypothetical protein U5L10_04165 [Candidatus Moranbacteria bacterium]|nr:hypothetical protein [Candidatus Moranbacteria bacterium]
MNNQNQYKTIFFDWNKTLSNSLFWEQLADPNHQRHNWHKDIINFVFVENKHLIKDWMRAKTNEEEIVDMISERFGYSKELLRKDLEQSCRNMQLVDNEILPLISQIRKKGVECVIATDNMDTFMKYTKPSLSLEKHFDDFLVSFDKKMLKFNVEENPIPFFDDYLRSKKLSYKDVLLIDDCIDKSGVYDKLGLKIWKILGTRYLLEKLRLLAK